MSTALGSSCFQTGLFKVLGNWCKYINDVVWFGPPSMASTPCCASGLPGSRVLVGWIWLGPVGDTRPNRIWSVCGVAFRNGEVGPVALSEVLVLYLGSVF